MRRTFIAVGTIAYCALQVAHTAVPDLKKLLGGSQPTERVQDAAAAPSADPNCPRSGSTGKLGPLEIASSAATRLALNAASRELQLGAVELPERIDDVCQARKRLSYVERATSRWSVNVIESIRQAKQALDIDQEIDSYRAFTGNPDFAKASDKDITRLRKDLENDLELIEAAIKDKRVDNQELLAEASANMRAAVLHGGLIGAWDRRLIEFLSDNVKWAYQNHQSVLMFRNHATLLGSTLRSVGAVSEAHSASAANGADEQKAESIMKKREQENQEFEKQLAAELQL